MALIVGVHGIGQQLKGAPKLTDEWWPSLDSGLDNARRPRIKREAFACAFYGGLFRGPAETRIAGDPYLIPADVQDPYDQELIQELWTSAGATGAVGGPQTRGTRGVPVSVQAGLEALSQIGFFAGISESLMIGSLRQVRLYLNDDTIRTAAQDAVHQAVTAETRVLVAHSLGSVVAYEAMHRFADQPNWANVRTLVTLGSPLGIKNLVFDRLRPTPVSGTARWPPLAQRWTNVSDDHDVVALVKRLSGGFGPGITDVRIDNGATAHDVGPYLTSDATGAAIADGLV